MSFEACESSNLMHSVPLPRVGIADSRFGNIILHIDNQLFTLNYNDGLRFAFQRFSVSAGGMLCVNPPL